MNTRANKKLYEISLILVFLFFVWGCSSGGSESGRTEPVAEDLSQESITDANNKNTEDNYSDSMDETSSIPPGKYIFDVNPDLTNIRSGGDLRTYFAFGDSQWRALSIYVDQDTFNNSLPGNSAGFISFELLEENFMAWRVGEDREPEQVEANLVVYPEDYRMGYFTSPGEDYIHYIKGSKAGRYDPDNGSLELFLSLLDPETGEDQYDVWGDTQYAGTRIIMPYDPLGTETYSNFKDYSLFDESLETSHTVSGARVFYNEKIFLYSGVASFAGQVQSDTNQDGTIDMDDDLVDANEDEIIDEFDIPDDLNLDGIVDEKDMVHSWKVTLVTAGNIGGSCVIAAACHFPYVHVLDGVIFPAQDL